MKLKHIIFTTLILIILLLTGETTVMADFIQNKTALKYNGSSLTYNSGYTPVYGSNIFANEWYESQNVFCLEAGAENPMSAPNLSGVTPIFYTTGYFADVNSIGTKTIGNVDLHKMFYVYAQLKENATVRIYNWDVAEQHAIWDIMGTTSYRSHSSCGRVTEWRGTSVISRETCYIKDQQSKYNSLAETVADIKGMADTYYQFINNNPNLDNIKLNFDGAKLDGNKYGPVKIENYTPQSRDNGKVYTYGGIKEVTIGGTKYSVETETTSGNYYFYVKDVTNLNNINGKVIKVTLEGTVSSDSYLAFIKNPDGQDYVFGGAKFSDIVVTATINAEQLQFDIKKVDEKGNSLAGATIGYAGPYIEVTEGGKKYLNVFNGTSITETGSEQEFFKTFISKINQTQTVVASGINPDENPTVYIKVQEFKFPSTTKVSGETVQYKGYEGTFVLQFDYNVSSKTWECKKILSTTWDNEKGLHSLGTDITTHELLSISGNTLTIKNEPIENSTIEFSIKKEDDSGNSLGGAKIGYQGPYVVNSSGYLDEPTPSAVVNPKVETTDTFDSEKSHMYTYTTPASGATKTVKIIGLNESNVDYSKPIYIKVQELDFPKSGWNYTHTGYKETFVLEFIYQSGSWKYNGIFPTNWNEEKGLHSVNKNTEDMALLSNYTKFNNSDTTLTIINKEIVNYTNLKFEIKKVDEDGNPLSGAKIGYQGPYVKVDSAGYLNWQPYGSEVTNANIKANGDIKEAANSMYVYMTDGNTKVVEIEGFNSLNTDITKPIYVKVQELSWPLDSDGTPYEFTHIGYQGTFVLEFKYNETDKKWECKGILSTNWNEEKVLHSVGESITNSKFLSISGNTLTIKNIPVENSEIVVNIRKVDEENKPLAGAVIGFQGPYIIEKYKGKDYVVWQEWGEILSNATSSSSTETGEWASFETFETIVEREFTEVKITGINGINTDLNKPLYLKICEMAVPEGYSGYTKAFILEFTYSFESNQWTCTGIWPTTWNEVCEDNHDYDKLHSIVAGGKIEVVDGKIETTEFSGNRIKFNKTYSEKENVVTIINNKDKDLEFTIKKVDESEELLSGATIGYSTVYKQNDDGYLVPEYDSTISTEGTLYDDGEGGSYFYKYNTNNENPKNISVTTKNPEAGDEIYIKIKEFEVPTNYSGYTDVFALKYKFDADEYVWKYDGIYSLSWHEDVVWNDSGDKGVHKVEGNLSEESIDFDEATKTLKIKNTKTDGTKLNFNLYKTNDEGTYLSGAKFKITVSNGKVNGSTSKTVELVNPSAIEITPTNMDKEVKITIKEVTQPSGYKKLTEDIIIKCKYEDGKWKKEITQGSEYASLAGNKLTIINTIPDTPDIELTLKKIDANGGGNLSGANFDVDIENGTSSDNSITIGTKTITITPKSADENVVVTLTETSAPSDYEIGSPVTIIYKYNGSRWEIADIAGDATNSGNTVRIKNTKIDGTKDTIEGTVFLDGYAGTKDVDIPNGTKDSGEKGIEGVIVKLSDGRETVTDSNGYYKFANITRGQNYTVTFEYDGVNYEATPQPSSNTSATNETEASQAKEDATARQNFNKKFETINPGTTAGGIGLDYWPYGDTSNNPTFDSGYAGKSWLLKTITNSKVVISEDFKMTASTNFKLKNTYQEAYNTYEYNADCEYNEPEDGEGEGSWSCSTSGPSDAGITWADEGQSAPSDGSHSHNGTWYKYSYNNTNYDIYGGTDNFKRYYYYHNEYTTQSTRNDPVTYKLNFGLLKREVDLSLVNDLYEVDASINGKSTKYNYAEVPLLDSEGATLDSAGTNKSNSAYSYLLELTESDFYYGTGIYQNPDQNAVVDSSEGYVTDSGHLENDPLEIYATYRIALNNQSATIAKINSIAYYYDSNYILSDVYVGNYSGEKIVELPEPSPGTEEIEGVTYKKINIESLGLELTEGAQKYVYITLKMVNTTDGSIGRKTYNTIAEITSYSTPDEEVVVGTNQGKVDIDSAPGNCVQAKKLVYEDDTDMAPGLSLELENDARILSGNVWDDSEKENFVYKFADGEREGEHGISGVKVQLIEIREETDGKHYYIWQQTETDNDGDYKFNNFIPGNYIVRFIYGNGTTEDVKKYNGQDYKSTTDLYYTEYKNKLWYNEYYDKYDSDAEYDMEYTSVARDNEARRLYVIANTASIDTNLGEKLRDKTNLKDTYMYADTSQINIALAFDNLDTVDGNEDEKETDNDSVVKGRSSNNGKKYFNFTTVNFGIEERPKTAIELQKHVTGLRITANDGTTIVDATYEDIFSGGIIDFTDNSIRKSLTGMRATTDERGYWRLETDIDEVLAGATLEIKYTYTVTNIGETDYISTTLAQEFENNDAEYYADKLKNNYAPEIRNIIKSYTCNSVLGKYLGTTYYTGKVEDDVSLVKTNVGKIEDYINNDLKFTEVNSSDFKVDTSKSDKNYTAIERNEEGDIAENDAVRIRTVVISKYNVGNIAPNKSKEKTIALEADGKLTSTGVLEFPSNLAQIRTAYSNPMGRRDVYSVPGNLKYISIPKDTSIKTYAYEIRENKELENKWLNLVLDADIEPDTYWAETVEITKPTGEDEQSNTLLIISIAAGIAIIGAGAIAIKKYVL